MSDVIQRLARKRLLIVTGKGGVGKSLVTAALGLELSRAGRRVLLLETDPRESLCHALDETPSGGGIVRTESGLCFQNHRVRNVLDAFVRERIGIKIIARKVIESAVYQHAVATAPGVSELALLGYAQSTVVGKRPTFDIVLIDAPATGHGLAMMRAPQLVASAIERGPLRALADRLALFQADPERSGVIIVTTAEEMPVNETLELIAALEKEFSRRPELLITNGLYPAPTAEEADTSLIELCRRRHEVNRHELARLCEAWPGPRIDLPLIPLETGLALTRELARRLSAQRIFGKGSCREMPEA